jgi:hypothetical protein
VSADYRSEQVLADRRSRLDRLEAEVQRLAGLLERTLAAVEQAAAVLERLTPATPTPPPPRPLRVIGGRR